MTQAREQWAREWFNEAANKPCPHGNAQHAWDCGECGYLAGLDRAGMEAVENDPDEAWPEAFHIFEGKGGRTWHEHITGRYEVDDE